MNDSFSVTLSRRDVIDLLLTVDTQEDVGRMCVENLGKSLDHDWEFKTWVDQGSTRVVGRVHSWT